MEIQEQKPAPAAWTPARWRRPSQGDSGEHRPRARSGSGERRAAPPARGSSTQADWALEPGPLWAAGGGHGGWQAPGPWRMLGRGPGSSHECRHRTSGTPQGQKSAAQKRTGTKELCRTQMSYSGSANPDVAVATVGRRTGSGATVRTPPAHSFPSSYRDGDTAAGGAAATLSP